MLRRRIAILKPQRQTLCSTLSNAESHRQLNNSVGSQTQFSELIEELEANGKFQDSEW